MLFSIGENFHERLPLKTYGSKFDELLKKGSYTNFCQIKIEGLWNGLMKNFMKLEFLSVQNRLQKFSPSWKYIWSQILSDSGQNFLQAILNINFMEISYQSILKTFKNCNLRGLKFFKIFLYDLLL